MIKKALSFMKAALSEENGVGSIRRVLVAAAVAGCLAFCAYDVVAHKGLRNESIGLATAVLYAAVGLFGVTRLTDK